jgi:hypothetical protein
LKEQLRKRVIQTVDFTRFRQKEGFTPRLLFDSKEVAKIHFPFWEMIKNHPNEKR